MDIPFEDEWTLHVKSDYYLEDRVHLFHKLCGMHFPESVRTLKDIEKAANDHIGKCVGAWRRERVPE